MFSRFLHKILTYKSSLPFQEQDTDLVFDDNQLFRDEHSLNKNSDSPRTNLVSKRSISGSDNELEDNQFEIEDDKVKDDHWLSRLKRSVQEFLTPEEPENVKKQKHRKKKKKDKLLKDEGFERVLNKSKNGHENLKKPKKLQKATKAIRPTRDLEKFESKLFHFENKINNIYYFSDDDEDAAASGSGKH